MSLRKIHFWLSLIGLTQMALWILSGVGFALLPDDEVNGLVSSRRLEPAPVPAETVSVAPSDIVADAEIQKITLTTRAPSDRPVYVVNLKGESGPDLIDACSGDKLSIISEADATEVARRDFSGAGDVAGVEWISEKYQTGFDYNSSLPAYRVNFSDWKHTRIYVSPYTGQILARRNVYKSARDLFWTVHVFGYLDREVPNNIPLIAAGVVSLAAATSGALIYIPYIRRRKLPTSTPESGWRRVHFWVGLPVFAQVVLWIASGIVFSVIYDRAIGGERESRNLEPAPLSDSNMHVTPDQIPARLSSRLGHSAAIKTISLQSHGLDGRPVYIVSHDESESPVILDAQTGNWMDRLNPDQAREIAKRDFAGTAAVESVETLTRPYEKGYDYFGELPVYRVNFANWKGTRIYVSPNTGDIRLRRNIDKTLFDLGWTLHMFGYVSHDINGNPGLIAAGAVSIALLMSGIALYIPYFKRKPFKRN